MKILTRLIASILVAVLIFIGCKKDEKSRKLDANGLTRDINDFVPAEILDEMKSQGMNINTGDNPPSIEGTYFASPVFLIGTNRVGDMIGERYSDNTFTFFDQDNDELTIRIKSRETSSTGQGAGGFIVGDNGYFTVFGRLAIKDDDYDQEGIITEVVSGKFVDGDIVGMQIALFMIDNDGDPAGIWIDNGDGRTFADGDELSERIDEYEARLKSKSVVLKTLTAK